MREVAELKVQLKLVEETRDNIRRDLIEANRRIREGKSYCPLICPTVCGDFHDILTLFLPFMTIVGCSFICLYTFEAYIEINIDPGFIVCFHEQK